MKPIQQNKQVLQYIKNQQKQMPNTKAQKNAKEQKQEPPKPEQNQKHEQQHQPEVKQMRRIHQRQQMPTDKAQLIQYLSERIKQAEQALNDTQQLLQVEVGERQKISKSIDSRNDQLQKLYQVDQKGLPDKIKQKLAQILTETINQKLDAQEKLKQQKLQNYQYKSMYQQLKWEEQQSKLKLQQLGDKENAFNKQISDYEQLVESHQKQLKQLEEQFQGVKQKKQSLEDKYLQMKVALERMTDIKAVLNRFFGNQDLFDQKMDLKQQKVSRPQVNTPSQQQQNQTRMPSRQNRNATKLKPLNNSRKKQITADQDFWKGDFTAKTRNY